MQPNHQQQPHPADQSQYYYPAMAAVGAYPYAAAPGGYYHQEHHYMVAPGQPQPLVMPVAQPPMIIMASPAPGAYPYAAYPTAPHASMYYHQEMPMQQQQQQPHSATNSESSVRPLLTSTPLPPENCARYARTPYQNQRHMRGDHTDVTLADLSKISIGSPDETICDMPTQSEYKMVLQHKQSEYRNKQHHRQHNQQQQQQQHPVPTNYKTKLCSNHAKQGSCGMGQKCLFAHGEEELREQETPRANNKYKTRLCRHFQKNRYAKCPYGDRCEFIHPQDAEYQQQTNTEWRRPFKNNRFIPRNGGGQGDVTPEITGEAPGTQTLSRSAAKPAPEKVLLQSRKVAGSMISLNQDFSSDSSHHHNHQPSFFGQRRLQPARSVLALPKFERRRSISQQNLDQVSLKRCSSLEFLAGSMRI